MQQNRETLGRTPNQARGRRFLRGYTVPVLGDSPCRNCGSPCNRAYCCECGQRQGEVDLSVRAWFRDVLDELTGADNRLRSTLRSLLTTPGTLALNWTQGRRSAYLSPSGLYLISAAVFVGVTALFSGGPLASHGPGVEPQGPIITGVMGAVRGWAEAPDGELTVDGVDLSELQDRAARWMSATFRWMLLVVMVPALALLTKALLGRREDYLATHLVFSLHLHSFLLLLTASTLLVLDLVARVTQPSVRDASYLVVPIGLGWYLFSGARLLFKRGRLSIVLRAVVALTLYGAGLAVAVTLVGIAAATA